MKKLRNNKYIILAICVIAISTIYFCVQKVIDNYIFNTNEDIITDESLNGEVENDLIESMDEDSDMDSKGSSDHFSDEETELVMEELEEENESDGAVGEWNNLEVHKIYVYVTGEVNNPGVVVINEGSRIVDAINAAGGTTVKANVSKVNLVYVLEDGMKVNIPNDNDLKDNADFEYITMNSGDGGKEDYLNSRSSESSGRASSNGNSKNYGIVNINTATQTELETLPGIGPSLALKIINYRKENGKFSSIDEIKNVSGIGDNKFEELKGHITV